MNLDEANLHDGNLHSLLPYADKDIIVSKDIIYQVCKNFDDLTVCEYESAPQSQ